MSQDRCEANQSAPPCANGEESQDDSGFWNEVLNAIPASLIESQMEHANVAMSASAEEEQRSSSKARRGPKRPKKSSFSSQDGHLCMESQSMGLLNPSGMVSCNPQAQHAFPAPLNIPFGGYIPMIQGSCVSSVIQCHQARPYVMYIHPQASAIGIRSIGPYPEEPVTCINPLDLLVDRSMYSFNPTIESVDNRKDEVPKTKRIKIAASKNKMKHATSQSSSLQSKLKGHESTNHENAETPSNIPEQTKTILKNGHTRRFVEWNNASKPSPHMRAKGNNMDKQQMVDKEHMAGSDARAPKNHKHIEAQTQLRHQGLELPEKEVVEQHGTKQAQMQKKQAQMQTQTQQQQQQQLQQELEEGEIVEQEETQQEQLQHQEAEKYVDYEQEEALAEECVQRQDQEKDKQAVSEGDSPTSSVSEPQVYVSMTLDHDLSSQEERKSADYRPSLLECSSNSSLSAKERDLSYKTPSEARHNKPEGNAPDYQEAPAIGPAVQKSGNKCELNEALATTKREGTKRKVSKASEKPNVMSNIGEQLLDIQCAAKQHTTQRRPINAFMAFVSHMREMRHQEGQEFENKEFIREMSKLWKESTPEFRRSYRSIGESLTKSRDDDSTTRKRGLSAPLAPVQMETFTPAQDVPYSFVWSPLKRKLFPSLGQTKVSAEISDK